MGNVFAENLLPKDKIKGLLDKVQQQLTKIGTIKKMSKFTPIDRLSGRFIIEGDVNSMDVLFLLTPEQQPLIHQVKVKIRKNH